MEQKQEITRDSQKRILVADDDPVIAGLVCDVLDSAGFRTTACANGISAVEAFMAKPYDLVVLDIMMPLMDGFEALQHIRKESNVPVVFLSAKDEESDTVAGFALGADDYIVKPFKPRELVARVKARLRSAECIDNPSPVTALACGLTIDPLGHSAEIHGEMLALTPKEFSILALLAKNAGQPVSAKELFEDVWHEPYQTNDANTIMVHIRRLRKKIACVDSSQHYIETVFGVGYKIPQQR